MHPWQGTWEFCIMPCFDSGRRVLLKFRPEWQNQDGEHLTSGFREAAALGRSSSCNAGTPAQGSVTKEMCLLSQ